MKRPEKYYNPKLLKHIRAVCEKAQVKIDTVNECLKLWYDFDDVDEVETYIKYTWDMELVSLIEEDVWWKIRKNQFRKQKILEDFKK